MRILQVNLCRAVGGSSYHHADLALGLKQRGHDLLVMDRLGEFTHQATGGEIPHHPAQRGRLHLGLLNAIRWFEPDLIHAHQSLGSRIANRVKGALPVISTIHGNYKARSYARSDGIIRIADHQRARMNGYEGPSLKVANWLRASPSGEVDRTGLRQELGIEPDEMLFGSVCRVVESKGVFELIAAFQAVQEQRARLVIIGDGKDLTKARDLAKHDKRILFVGHREDARQLMQAMDVFVLMSHAEALPLALIEAAAAGCPIISTETLGAKELLRGQPVTMIPVGGTKALEDELRLSLTHRKARVRYDLSGFDRSRQIDATVSFYHQVLESRAPAAALVGSSA